MATQPNNKADLISTMKRLKEPYVQMGREEDAQRVKEEIHALDEEVE